MMKVTFIQETPPRNISIYSFSAEIVTNVIVLRQDWEWGKESRLVGRQRGLVVRALDLQSCGPWFISNPPPYH